MKDRCGIRLTGTGGQGLILAGIVLAEAVLLEGKNAVQSQSYGPEARGGASKAEVIISSGPIHYPKIVASDFLLSMSEKAYLKYRGGMAEGSVLIVDSTFVTALKEPKAKTVYSVPITQIALDETDREMTANIVALGVLAGLGLVGREALQTAVLHRIPRGTEDLNVRALAAGIRAMDVSCIGG